MYSSVVISKQDLNRIKNEIVPIYNEGDMRHSVDSNLKSLSQAKIKAWPDSIEMANKNHFDQLKRQFFANEDIKRRTDKEEKKYFNILKNRITNKAQELFFHAQDPVKSFVSKMRFCDVLTERKIQLKNKKAKEERMKQYDAYWESIERQAMVDQDQNELKKKDIQRLKKKSEYSIVNLQFSEAKIKQVQDIQEKFIEGQIIKKNALKAIEEERLKEVLLKEKSQRQNEEFKKANEEIEKLKEEKKKLDEEEDKKIEEYAKRKQHLSDLRKKKEIEKAKAKQEQRQKLIDRQIENLSSLKSKEEQMINKHIEETDTKKSIYETEKRAKYCKMQNEIIEDRKLYIKRMKETKEKEKQEDFVRAQEWRKEVKQMEKKDIEDYLLKRQKQKRIAEYQCRQAKEKRDQALEQFTTIQEDSFYTKAMISKEQDTFIVFAEEQIKNNVEQGKEILPLLFELKNYKKKYQV